MLSEVLTALLALLVIPMIGKIIAVKTIEFLNASWLTAVHIRIIWTALIFAGFLYLLFGTSILGRFVMLHAKLNDWIGYCVCAVCGAVALCSFWWFTGHVFRQSEAIAQTKELPQTELRVGDESVVVGKVPANTKIGNRSTVVGATDDKDNSIISPPPGSAIAIGAGAKAETGSVAVGTGAEVGGEVSKEQSKRQSSPTDREEK